jgi:hypothetical protein
LTGAETVYGFKLYCRKAGEREKVERKEKKRGKAREKESEEERRGERG